MGVKIGFLFLLVLSALATLNARQLPRNLEAMQYHMLEKGSSRNGDVCAWCEEYAALTLKYLHKNKTQSEVIELLHLTCSQVPMFKTECIILVDYYVPIFFLEVSSMQPEEICKDISLCKSAERVSPKLKEDSCEFCHDAVSLVLDRLKDPDIQLDIIELLLKACDSLESYENKCKKMVFEYGPLILANMEQFLEAADVCAVLHVCTKSEIEVEEPVPTKETPLLSDS
ncbi:prosaposin-like [Rhodamnia argentea]|uniref:Pulmonary surfactant-associated protein B n=1 Tax=Rhodamnia argentea TaxID=178133 RepID=A0A8B8PWS9_9MYRT|nr:prosaposin-like [Rhodamnia argentea]XP_030538724.1 prosaposin-like [Rhodamnia argentea]